MPPTANEQSSEDDLCRELTSFDVDRALHALKINRKQTNDRSECDCCRLLRVHSSLPLARRGRPHIPTRSRRLLCPNCMNIKRQQQIKVLQTQQKYPTIMNVDISSNEQLALANPEYQSNQKLVWSLTANDKKILLDQTIKKLQLILNNHPTIRDDDPDHFEFTYRTLQTTISILSSSHHSI